MSQDAYKVMWEQNIKALARLEFNYLALKNQFEELEAENTRLKEEGRSALWGLASNVKSILKRETDPEIAVMKALYMLRVIHDE